MTLLSIEDAAREFTRTTDEIADIVAAAGLTLQHSTNSERDTTTRLVDPVALRTLLDLEALRKQLDRLSDDAKRIKIDVTVAQGEKRKTWASTTGWFAAVATWIAAGGTVWAAHSAASQIQSAAEVVKANNAFSVYNSAVDALERAVVDQGPSRLARVPLLEDRLWIGEQLEQEGFLSTSIWSKIVEQTCGALRNAQPAVAPTADISLGSPFLDDLCGVSMKDADGPATKQSSG